MSLPLLPLPSLARPDLKPAAGEGGPVAAPRPPEVMVRFLDRTWRLCKIAGWRRDPGGWACHLLWGVSGRIADGWYQHDPEKMAEP